MKRNKRRIATTAAGRKGAVDAVASRPAPRWLAATLIAMSLVAFAILSYTSAVTKSSIFDESMHAVAGAVHRQLNDFRMDMENPPLWTYWANLPNRGRPLALDLSLPSWKGMLGDNTKEWDFAALTLYKSLETDGEGYIRRCRPMMIVLGVLLGGVLAVCAWQIGGARAGLIAVVLFAFDPTFLAHSPLVKNDVPITLVTFALFWTVWLVGRHATFIAIGTLILMSAFTLTVKFSGVVLVPIAAVLLFVRALMSFEWPFAGRKLANRWSRLALAMLLAVLMAASAYVSAWASYGFRFQASAAGEPIDTKRLLLVSSSFQAELERPNADEGELRKRIQENVTDDWSTRLTEFALRHRLMPEAWLNGLLIQKEWMRGRPAYLCGHYSTTGWWYYFPLAVLFKSPLGTILAAGVLIICVLSRPLPYITRARDSLKMPGVWTAIAFSVPVAVYGLMALTSHINIGVRHVLPLYPFGFLAIALGLSYLIERRPRVGRTLVGILFAVLTAETLIAWPHYLAFFNIACGGYRGGFHLLADSNLDWGQDLPLLSKWQRARPNERLYFDYDKNVPPIAYDIRSAPVGQYSIFAQPAGLPDGRPYVAVGATVLQKVYSQSELYDKLLKVEPTAVLGGSIYVWAENSAALNWLGVTLMNMNRIPESLSAFKRAIELQPDNPLLHKNLASALNRSNRNAEAIEQLRLAIKLDPNDAIAHNNLGTALHSAGDHQAAIAEFERAVELRPDVVSSRLNLAEMLRQQGEHSRAIKQYQIVLNKEATSARAYAGLARSLAMLNRSREAIETAQKGITSARSNGQQAEAEKIEEWLGHYQREIERGGGEEPKPQAGPAEK